MAVDNRALDVKDILTKVTTGWITPPNEPVLVMEDHDNQRGSYLGRVPSVTVPDNGFIFIKQDWDYDREKITNTHANRLWRFPIAIISQSAIKLQGVFDQTREVFDRYTSAPWSTGTLGTGTTYQYAGVENGKRDFRNGRYIIDCEVLLLESIAAVVTA